MLRRAATRLSVIFDPCSVTGSQDLWRGGPTVDGNQEDVCGLGGGVGWFLSSVIMWAAVMSSH